MILLSDLLTTNKYLLAFPEVSLREKQGEAERNPLRRIFNPPFMSIRIFNPTATQTEKATLLRYFSDNK